MGRRKIAAQGLRLVVLLLILLTAVVPRVMAQTEKAEAQRRAKIEKAQKTLAGTAWTVHTTLQDTKRPEEGTETFTFTERRVTTQNLAAQGYAAGGSNYSVYAENDGAFAWETMLKDEEGKGEVLLRGDLRGDVMTGVIDIKPAKGARKIYYFTSSKEKPKAAEEVMSTTAPVTTTTTTTTETKKETSRRRGW